MTPARDALHRLTGERLVEAPRHEGFRVPMLTETMLRHLCGWHLDLLLLATARRNWDGDDDDGESEEQQDRLERQNALFLRLAGPSGNPEHLAALRSLAEKIEPYQRLADALLDEIEPECERIGAAVRSGDRSALAGAWFIIIEGGSPSFRTFWRDCRRARRKPSREARSAPPFRGVDFDREWSVS